MSTVATIPTIKKENTSRIKWIAPKAVYAITRIEETPIRVLYLSERGGDHDHDNKVPRGMPQAWVPRLL